MAWVQKIHGLEAGSILKRQEKIMQKNELEKYEKLISSHFKKKNLNQKNSYLENLASHLQFLHMVQPRLWNL